MVKLKQYGDYLYQLQHFGMINVYFVQEADGLTLIDTGIAGTARLIEEAVVQLQQPLRRIVLTHAHSDHVGGLDALHVRHPQAEVMISRRDAKWLAGDDSLEPHEPVIPLRKQQLGVQTVPTRLLEHGDSIGSLQVHDAKGHTPGQLAFFDERDKSLIAGDALVSLLGFGSLAVAGVRGVARWRFPLPHIATWSAALALESAQTLLQLEPTRLAVGHGRVLSQPMEQMRQACIRMARGRV